MKIISCNVNGIRSAYKKGLIEFINKQKPDVFCLQEVKADEASLPEELLNIVGYSLCLNSATKKGYSGTAIYSKDSPILINKKLGIDRFDGEGRIIELNYGDITIINVYIPHGGRQKENLDYKLDVYNKLIDKLISLKNKKVIVIGDFNIAHEEIDLARPTQNKNNIMFTVEERKQIDRIIDLGFADSFRVLNQNPGNYTWWPYAFNAKERNMGWRIDYIFVSKELSNNMKNAKIYPECSFSDHCPISLEI
jgi:exodeoxyribonuclease III